MVPCPKCGHAVATDTPTCEKCGHAMTNGAVQRVTGSGRKPPPPEAAGWVIHKMPPEIREEMRRSFNEEEFIAELREAERAGLPELKDLIRDLEQEMAPHE